MQRDELRFRQIHLDFHTSEAITGIGSEFDPEEFARVLAEAHVDSVTCFARCHHGWIYYDTKAFPERKHPHLTRNLLAEQIEACHARGMKVPIYITVQWDHYTAERHPEWRVITADGRLEGTGPYEAGFYRHLCLNTPYVDFLKEHVREVLKTLPVDGLFFDIVKFQDCSCRFCRESMFASGLDPANPADRKVFGHEVLNRFKREMSAFVRQFHPDCTIFYNSGHIGPELRESMDAYTHWEIESLPGGAWGYRHFPLTVRYARRLGKDCLGMTGKFHTTWGDFHSYKNQAALEFECFRNLAMGAKCSVGDQLHPSGRIDRHAYELVGRVYAEVKKKEPWCRGVEPVVDIGVLTPAEFTGERTPESAVGAMAMLQEGGHQFDVIDSAGDFNRYRVLILPDTIPVSDALAAKLRAYLARGGAVIASHEAGLDVDKTRFVLGDAFGIEFKGPAPYSPDFVVPKGPIGSGLPEAEHVMYLQGTEVGVHSGAEVLAETVIPYFNRTYRHFFSHRHTPSRGTAGYPAVVRKGQAIYFAHPIFTTYQRRAPRWCKQLFLNALELVLPDPVLRLEAPSTTIATVNDQPTENRWVVHLLHYIPERRGSEIEVIEDVIPLYNVVVSVKVPRPVATVMLVPEGKPLDFTPEGERIRFTVPEVRGHQMIELRFA